MNAVTKPAISAIQELVPSRYAVTVGEIDVLVISDGVLPLPAVTMATNAAPADLALWLTDSFLPPEAFDWPLNVMLVRSGEQTILVDTGLGSQFPGFPRAGQVPQRLAAAGVELDAITDIIITHMHMDHVGGLLVEGVKERLRPDVRIHVAAAEVEFWRAPDFGQTECRPRCPTCCATRQRSLPRSTATISSPSPSGNRSRRAWSRA